MNKRLPLAALLAAGLAVLSACSDGKDAPAIASTAAPSTSTATASPSESPSPSLSFTAPLTGLPVAQEVSKRPLAIMINNLKPARPQSGLTHADMVWEILAEGGITRLVAFFQSDASTTDPIGPIRSIRPYLIDLGETYGGVLVHAGASNDALAVLQREKKPDLDEINNAGAYFYRDKTRKAPHNLYSTVDKLRAGAAHRKYEDNVPMPHLLFDANPDLSGATPATSIAITYELKNYTASYAFDAATGTYLRSINGEPHIDKNNDKQLAATNLVVIRTKHKTYDSYGRLIIDLDSGGEALLFQKGQVLTCTWERKSGDAFRLMKDGKELPLLPGVTWYHVVPDTKTMADHVKVQ